MPAQTSRSWDDKASPQSKDGSCHRQLSQSAARTSRQFPSHFDHWRQSSQSPRPGLQWTDGSPQRDRSPESDSRRTSFSNGSRQATLGPASGSSQTYRWRTPIHVKTFVVAKNITDVDRVTTIVHRHHQLVAMMTAAASQTLLNHHVIVHIILLVELLTVIPRTTVTSVHVHWINVRLPLIHSGSVCLNGRIRETRSGFRDRAVRTPVTVASPCT